MKIVGLSISLVHLPSGPLAWMANLVKSCLVKSCIHKHRQDGHVDPSGEKRNVGLSDEQ